MIVKELIEKLRTFDDKIPVVVCDGPTEKSVREVKWRFDGMATITVEN